MMRKSTKGDPPDPTGPGTSHGTLIFNQTMNLDQPPIGDEVPDPDLIFNVAKVHVTKPVVQLSTTPGPGFPIPMLVSLPVVLCVFSVTVSIHREW